MSIDNKVYSVLDVGNIVRARRKKLRLSQVKLAKLAGVGIRFLSELENGKPTAHSDKVFCVVNALGLVMSLDVPKSDILGGI